MDVAVGHNHIVALTADNKVYTAGDGMQGQLSVGYQQFSLHSTNTSMSDAEESWEFAEDWQAVSIATVVDPRRKMKVTTVGAGWESTLLVLSVEEN